jgi:hypothetical protein
MVDKEILHKEIDLIRDAPLIKSECEANEQKTANDKFRNKYRIASARAAWWDYPYSNRGDLNTSFLFGILRENMFNLKYQTYEKYPSFIHSVEWDDFINDINRYIDIALEIRANINDYNVRKNV